VPRILIKGSGTGDSSTGSVIEALMAMLLSDKLGAAVADQAPRSPEIEALRQQIRESMAKPATEAQKDAPKSETKKK
jgi:hypothetical protein